MTKRIIVAICLASWFAAGPGLADPLHRVELGIYLGPSAVDLDGADGDVVKAVPKTSYMLGATGSVRLHELVAIQAELVYARKGSDLESNGIYTGTFNFSYIQVPLLFRADLPFFGERIRPYLHLGASLSSLLKAENVDDDGSVSELSTVSSDDLSVLGGAGVNVLTKWGVMDFEVRYDHGIKNIADTGDDAVVKNRALSLFVGYRFGLLPMGGSTTRKPKIDLDVVADQGSKDAREHCKGQAAGKDGCRSQDSDSDGIHDDKDACPAEAEDANGYQSEDGCPDANKDDDGDGVLDAGDQCTDKPGWWTTDGCPRSYATLAIEKDRVVLADGTRMEFEKAQRRKKPAIKQSSLAALEDLARALAEHPALRLSIQAHTDEHGTNSKQQPKNLELSQQQAEAVRDALVERGVSAERLEAKGLGSAAAQGPGQESRRLELLLLPAAAE